MKKLLPFFLLIFSINSTIIHAQDCPNALPTGLSVGISAVFEDGADRNLYAFPESDVLLEVPADEYVTIQLGPVCGTVDGFRWWQVDYAGTSGWMAEGDATNYWLIEPPPVMFIMPGAGTDATEIPPTQIPPTAVPSPSFSNLSYQLQDDGVWFLVDADIPNRATQNLTTYIWFKDVETDEWLRNPLASDSVSNNNDTLFLYETITPTQVDQQYRGTDLSFYMPYYEFPRGTYNYYPVMILLDESGEQIHREDFTTTVINSTDHPTPDSGIVIRDISARFEDAGVTYFIDMDTIGYSSQELDVFLFFSDYGEEFLQNALPIEDYFQTDSGKILGWASITPCCDEINLFTGDHTISIYVPYNAFVPGTYSYFPVVTVERADEDEILESRSFREKQVRVLGDERPAGYIVNYLIDQIDVVYTTRHYTMNGRTWDNLMLSYTIYEVDSTGEEIPGEQQFFIDSVWSGSIRTSENFVTLLVDVLADSTLVEHMEFVDVANVEETKEARDALEDAGKLAKRGLRRLTLRVARVAAKSALRYVNGMLLIYDIVAFFEKDRLFDTIERTYSPDDLYQMWQQTGQNDNRDYWVTQDFANENQGLYEMTTKFWLYGYYRQAWAE